MNSPLLVCRTVADTRQRLLAEQRAGRRVGFIPTMGALHEGHLSLVEVARKVTDFVVVSIFVNPTQFGPSEDLDRYPRTWDADLEGLTRAGSHMVFAPTVDVMYPAHWSTLVEPPRVATSLEGECRPGHFRGVATVVLKLFQIVPADEAFFGEKDFQQCLVIRDMVRDLNVPVQIQFCPTIREPDGLAMSSRNRYLDSEQRQRAISLSRGLQHARQRVTSGFRDARLLEAEVAEILHQAPVDKIEYVAVRDPETLEPIAEVDRPAVLLIAARVGNTRLIDNCRL